MSKKSIKPLFSLFDKKMIEVHGKIVPHAEFATLMEIEELLEETKKQAKLLLEEAQKEADALCEKAKQDGYQEGLLQVNKEIFHVEDYKKVLKNDMQKKILPLTLATAKKIVGEEMRLSPDAVVDIVLEAIKKVTQSYHVKLKVFPDDYTKLEQEKDNILQKLGSIETFSLEASKDVPQGGCIIETEHGIINATLDNQFRAIEAVFEQMSPPKL